ncbi:MAG: hypothetical protein D6753_04665 [Planctomycetota bacterium]|nr:MAG: hypothetical protein D6753_04665 [Planctomycetota bacterium]
MVFGCLAHLGGCSGSKTSQEDLSAPIERTAQAPALDLKVQAYHAPEGDMAIVLYDDSAAAQDVLFVSRVDFETVLNDRGESIRLRSAAMNWQVVTDPAEYSGKFSPGTLVIFNAVQSQSPVVSSLTRVQRLARLEGNVILHRGQSQVLRIPVAEFGSTAAQDRLAKAGVQLDAVLTDAVDLRINGPKPQQVTRVEVVDRSGQVRQYLHTGGGRTLNSVTRNWVLQRPLSEGDLIGVWFAGEDPGAAPSWTFPIDGPATRHTHPNLPFAGTAQRARCLAGSMTGDKNKLFLARLVDGGNVVQEFPSSIKAVNRVIALQAAGEIETMEIEVVTSEDAREYYNPFSFTDVSIGSIEELMSLVR